MARFLRPTLWKIVLTIGLLVAASLLWRAYIVSRISDTFPLGFPFQFYLAWGPCPPGQDCSEFNGLYLLFDVVLWYAVSALLLDRLRMRP
jgi:hypothetical protein